MILTLDDHIYNFVLLSGGGEHASDKWCGLLQTPDFPFTFFLWISNAFLVVFETFDFKVSTFQ